MNRGAMITIRGAALLLALALLMGCGNGVAAPQTNSRSDTGLLISDIHFNPLADPALANSLVQAPASQWDSIFATSTQTAYASYETYNNAPQLWDTNFLLLQSALAAMRQRVPNPDVVFLSGDLLTHLLPVWYNKAVTNQPPGAYAAFVNTTEQYVAMKLAQTFPNAQIVPALGDWDTPCSSSDTYPGTGFLASFSSAWNRAVNRYGGAPNFQATFATGGYYSTTLAIDPQARLIVLDTQPWTPSYDAASCATGGGNLGNVELGWLTAQLANARSQGQRVWILGHIPPGVLGGSPAGLNLGGGAEPTSRAQVNAAGASCPIAPLYADAYAGPLYALFAQYREILTLGIFGHEHMDDYRLARDSSGNPIFGVKIVPSITPIDGNNPAFVQLSYNPLAGVISDVSTSYLTNLSSATTQAPGVWASEYDFDLTYGQNGLDTNGVAGAVNDILTQPSAQAAFMSHFSSMSTNPIVAITTFLPYGCALDKLTVADYSACYCGH
jgi:sphingomyelin phosphodiesterase acid-like 3